MDKKLSGELIKIAENVLSSTKGKNFTLFKKNAEYKIDEKYNGQISALGISVLTVGLKPTLAIYYQDNDGEVCRRNVLEIIVRMFMEYPKFGVGVKLTEHLEKMKTEAQNKKVPECVDAEVLLRYAVNLNLEKESEDELKRALLQCSTALKYIVRTYELVKDDGK